MLLVVVLALAGLAISGDLLRQHAGGEGSGLLARVCEALPGEAVSCDAALESAWAGLTLPIPDVHRDFSVSVRQINVPVAFFGVAYFAFMAAWFGIVRGREGVWARVPLHVAYCGLAVSILYTGLMISGTAPPCLWCFAVHGINVALIIRIRRVLKVTSGPTVGREMVAAMAVLAVMVGGAWMHYRALRLHTVERTDLQRFEQIVDDLRHDPVFLLREHHAQPWYEIPFRDGEGQSGRQRLVVFTDFECPACLCNALRIELEVRPSFGRGLDVHLRHFPLDGHPNAFKAALAAEAARRLGGEEALHAMHDQLFRNQVRLGEPDIHAELAVRIGLDPETHKRLMNDPATRVVVEADLALGSALGVAGTPAMFLDGRRITELVETPFFWTTIAGTHPPLARPPLETVR